MYKRAQDTDNHARYTSQPIHRPFGVVPYPHGLEDGPCKASNWKPIGKAVALLDTM